MKTHLRLACTVAVCAVLVLSATAGEGASAGVSPASFKVVLPFVARRFPGVCTLAPVPVWPTGGQTIPSLAPEFRFSPYTPLAEYDYMYLQYSESASFSNYVQLKIPNTYWSPYAVTPQSNLLAGRTYYWRLHEDCGAYRVGPWSATASFKTSSSAGTPAGQPTQTKPLDGATNTGTQVVFTWEPVQGAVLYKLSFAAQGSPPSHLFYPTPYRGLAGFKANTQYYWWVTALNGYAWGAESPHWAFHTGQPTTDAPEWVDPALDGVSLDGGITVTEWRE